MGHWTPSSEYSDSGPKKTTYDKDGSGVPTQGRVRQIVKSNTQNPKGWEYYELELAEVLEVFDSEEKLPENDKGEKIWGLLGCILLCCCTGQVVKPTRISDAPWR